MGLRRALLTVSDKAGLPEFARGLADLGVELFATEGTASFLRAKGVAVTNLEDLTGHGSILEGRVKTLHPKVHAAILAVPTQDAHMRDLAAIGAERFDIVVVNLYPFEETVARGADPGEVVENIDIGGVALLRSASKNAEHVVVLSDPRQYGAVLEEIRRQGDVSAGTRQSLALEAFALTSRYDAAISDWLARRAGHALPPHLRVAMDKAQDLRYGENPYQKAAFYRDPGTRGISLAECDQLHGKELSFNNLLDIDGAAAAVAPWPDRPVCAIIKHTTPCGIALGASTEDAYRRALATDPKSAFGSVVAFNTVVDAATAEAMRDLFVEVVVAPRLHEDALKVLTRKRNLRVVELPLADRQPALDFKRVPGGVLAQERFAHDPDESGWTVATRRPPTDAERRDLRFAWAAVAGVKSNAILLAKDEAAMGIGAGQMSRVDAAFLAVHKARDAGHDPTGCVLASDAFFPFADGVEQAADAGVTAIIQPGGSVRDDEVTAAADERGLAMIVTARRQFRH